MQNLLRGIITRGEYPTILQGNHRNLYIIPTLICAGNVFAVIKGNKQQVMKKIILSFLSIALFAGVCHAQEEQETKPVVPEIRKVGKLIRISEMDNRKIYNWGNGQRSTPTGRQADEPTAEFARVFGDSAVVVRRVILEK